MKKKALQLLILSVCLLMGSVASVMAEDPVYFVNASLKAAVEEELGITDPTPTDMLSLTTLNASYRGISDLTGIEYASNLRVLALEQNPISDISPLAGLSNLTALDLNYNWADANHKIRDFSPLARLTNLTRLDLVDNQISDISALSGLTNLTELWLSNNPISDISALSDLTNLTLLALGFNQISDISPLSGLTNLTDLGLNINQISDISPLSGLTNLTFLGLWDNQISDISSLSGLTNLTELHLGENKISDISPLLGLTNLTDLYLYHNQINDISPLSGLISLTELWLDDNQISDISALSEFTTLWTLTLGSNPLNLEAYCTYLPLIQDNNPGDCLYDPNPYPPEACLDDDGVSDGLFSIEGTQWQSLPIGMIIFPITDIGEVPTYEVGFHGGKVYESGIERKSFYMDMIVASIFMYTGESCNLPGDCWNYIGFGIIQPLGVGVMIVSNGIPIPSSVGVVILVKKEDNWAPPEDEFTTQ